MANINQRLSSTALDVYRMWVQGRILAQDEEAGLVFNGFLAAVHKLPGADRVLINAHRELQAKGKPS